MRAALRRNLRPTLHSLINVIELCCTQAPHIPLCASESSGAPPALLFRAGHRLLEGCVVYLWSPMDGFREDPSLGCGQNLESDCLVTHAASFNAV